MNSTTRSVCSKTVNVCTESCGIRARHRVSSGNSMVSTPHRSKFRNTAAPEQSVWTASGPSMPVIGGASRLSTRKPRRVANETPTAARLRRVLPKKRTSPRDAITPSLSVKRVSWRRSSAAWYSRCKSRMASTKSLIAAIGSLPSMSASSPWRVRLSRSSFRPARACNTFRSRSTRSYDREGRVGRPPTAMSSQLEQCQHLNPPAPSLRCGSTIRGVSWCFANIRLRSSIFSRRNSPTGRLSQNASISRSKGSWLPATKRASSNPVRDLGSSPDMSPTRRYA